MPRCSIIIPVYNKASLTRQCLDSLLLHPPLAGDFEIIVVDDASTDITQQLLASYGDRVRTVTHAANTGFGPACNDGAAVSSSEYLVLLNNDTIPQAGWLDALVKYADNHPQAAAVGSKLLFPNNTIQHAGVVICQDRYPRHIYAGFPADHPAVNKSRRFQIVTAGCVLIRRELFEQLGGFDPAFRNGHEDVDLCLRLGEQGYEVHYCHESVLYHLESVSRESRDSEIKGSLELYKTRWAHRIQPDDFSYYIEDGLLEINYQASLGKNGGDALWQLDAKDRIIRADDETIATLYNELAASREETRRVAALNESLRAQVEDSGNVIRARDETIALLQNEVAESDKNNRQLATQLSTKACELDQMTRSPGWRLLSRYGRLKYRYLLLAYRMLGLPPYSRTASVSIRAQVETLNKAIAPLQDERERRERKNELLLAQLSAKAHELDQITQSLGWRVLSRYGQFKYRHLLPLYRTLRLPPYGRTAGVDNGDCRLPLELHRAQSGAPPILQRDQETTESSGQPTAKHAFPLPLESNACDVICFPIIDWDFRFQRPQQLMSRFADAGHRVFYIAASFHSSGPAYTIQQKRKNIYEISLRGLPRIVYADLLNDEARDLLFASLNELRRDLLLGATVAFVQLPFWWPLVNKARAQLAWPIVYDCMDHHAGFSTNKQIMLDQERDLLGSADLVVVSSAFLQTQAQQHNSKVLLVRNACDYEHFAKVGESKSERPVIGYYGAIADWFDSDLVANLAERRPDWDFVLVGSTFSADLRRLSKLTNVSLPGEKHYAEIPNWLGEFDVAIIPFKRSALTEATNPVKAYEILASGKPLVSVPIPEMASLAPLVRLATNAEEFEKEITEALAENEPELIDHRRAFAKENTWQKRCETLASSEQDLFPKASIIVVTFNNLQLNRLCLESIFERTEWPNLEVIVVDNNSSDGTPEYLREAERSFPRLQVILNESNLGFAAANNIGLRQAMGDYLVLLNNDTVVTRGWVSTLIRHLHRDAKIGMIGPVTNVIGNDAKVEVGYTRLDEMPAWAANYVQQHDGQVFPIPMLKMFCVAMRKEVFEQVGWLDEQFGIGLFEDDDYAHRIKANGLRVVCAADVFVHHFGQAAFKKLVASGEYQALFDENRRRYERKWNIEWVPHKYAPRTFEPTTIDPRR